MLRSLLLGLFLFTAAADDRTDVLEAVAPLASALSEGDAAAFLGGIDKDMPGYGDLVAGVTGLLNEAEVTCSVEFLSRKGGTAELDWYMQVRSKEQAGVTEQRHQTVVVRLGKKKVLSIGPIDFFGPLRRS